MNIPLRTPIRIARSPFSIALNQDIVAVGSCFTEYIGQLLVDFKFKTLINPFGVLFNPVSLFSLLQNSVNGALPAENTYILKENRWYNELFHSSFSAPDQSILAQQISQTFQETRRWLQKSDFLMLTLGTALTYRRQVSGNIVANCHKLPAYHFERSLLKVNDILEAFSACWEALKIHNPQLRLVLTVSPVRHLKDQLPLNAVSKSTLRLAVHEIQTCWPEIDYFPAYEILLDDLRDYRFYDTDLVHPNYTAIIYLWEYFCERYLDQTAQDFVQDWQKIKKALSHRPFHAGSNAHHRFIEDAIQKIRRLPYPLDFSAEIAQLASQK